MTIYVGSDHNGFSFKKFVISHLEKKGHKVIDVGGSRLDPNDDFPVFAARAIHAMKASDDHDAKTILICGSGQGMLMAANRFKGVRAGLGWSVEAARGIRHDEDSNVMALPSELLKDDTLLAADIIDSFLETPFANAARYNRRNRELDELS